MKEQLISFKTAKLAKEKGFDPECNLSDYAFGTFDGVFKQKTLACRHAMIFSRWINDQEKISAPTQSLLQKWLREEHGVHVCSISQYNTNRWFQHYYVTINGKTLDELEFETYEEALEAGLYQSMELIQKNF